MALIIVFMPVITRRRIHYYQPLGAMAGGSGTDAGWASRVHDFSRPARMAGTGNG
jgi:hypothetical protein